MRKKELSQEYLKWETTKRELLQIDLKIGLTAMKMPVIIENLSDMNDIIAFCRGDAILIDFKKSKKFNSENQLYILMHETLHRKRHINESSIIKYKKFIDLMEEKGIFNKEMYYIAGEIEIDLIILKKYGLQLLYPSYPMKEKWLRKKRDMDLIQIYLELYHDFIKAQELRKKKPYLFNDSDLPF